MRFRGCDSATLLKTWLPLDSSSVFVIQIWKWPICKTNLSFNIAHHCSYKPVGCAGGGSRMRAAEESPCSVPGVPCSWAPLPHSRVFSYLVPALREAAALLAETQVTSAGISLSVPLPLHPTTALLGLPAILYLPAALTHWCMEAIHQEEGNVSLVKSLTDR